MQNSPLPTGLSAHEHSALDKSVIASKRLELNNSLSNPADQARILATTSPQSGDWLYTLPLSGCGLRLDDRAVHIAVGPWLGAIICEPHQCPCAVMVDAKGLHGLSCKGGSGRSARHHALNDLIWQAEGFYQGLHPCNETAVRSAKRPDGVTLLPWKNGRCATWDVTVTDTMAQHISYARSCSRSSG